jgi:hypothetical protein
VAKHIWIALIAGFGISAMLFWVSYATSSVVLSWPQCAGFWVCMVLRGVHSSTKTDFAEIAIPINAAIYAMFIFLLLRAFRRSDTMPGHVMAKHISIALIAGPVASVVLFCVSNVPHCRFLILPQYAGWWICVTLRGFYTATKMDFARIMVPINTVIYTLFIFLLLRAFRRTDAT